MLITLVLGFVATQLGFKLPVTVFPIAIASLVGGVAILVIEQYRRRQAEVGQPHLVGGDLGCPGSDPAAVFFPVLPARRRPSSPPCSRA